MKAGAWTLNRNPGDKITSGQAAWCRYWEYNSGPSEEQIHLSNNKPSLQPINIEFHQLTLPRKKIIQIATNLFLNQNNNTYGEE